MCEYPDIVSYQQCSISWGEIDHPEKTGWQKRACAKSHKAEWLAQGFATLEAARDWVQQFIQWYNHQHQHSQIRFVTPAQRHAGEDKAILAKRKRVYEQAKATHPARWSGKTRNWSPITKVTLNPERQQEEEQAA